MREFFMSAKKYLSIIFGVCFSLSIFSFSVYADLTPEQQAVIDAAQSNTETAISGPNTPQQQFVQGDNNTQAKSNGNVQASPPAQTTQPKPKVDAELENSPQNLATSPSSMPFKPTSDNLKSLGFKPLKNDASGQDINNVATQAEQQTPQPMQVLIPAVQPAPNLPAVSNLSSSASQQAMDDIRNDQQMLQQRLTAIEGSSNTLQKQIAILGQYVIGLDEQISQMRSQLQKLNQVQTDSQFKPGTSEAKTQSTGITGYIQNQLLAKSWFRLILAVIAVAILLFFWDIFYRRREKKMPQITEGIKEEYDFMSGEEGVAARLNLARAYVDMGNNQAAEQILKEVMARGNETQKAEAEKLLQKIAPGRRG